MVYPKGTSNLAEHVISVSRIWIGLYSSNMTTLLCLFHPNLQVILITRNSNGSSEALWHQPTGGNIKVGKKQMIIQLVCWVSSYIHLYYCQKHYRNNSITFYITYSFFSLQVIWVRSPRRVGSQTTWIQFPPRTWMSVGILYCFVLCR